MEVLSSLVSLLTERSGAGLKFGHLWIRRMKVNAVFVQLIQEHNAPFEKCRALFSLEFLLFSGWNFHGKVLAKLMAHLWRC